MRAVTTRRLVFTPVAGHPGGRYALPASIPARVPVRAVEVRPGVHRVTISIDGADDYELEVVGDDLPFVWDEG